MANYRAKCQELLRLITDLQCYKCKDVPGPNENGKNRYSCLDSSHTLCEKDKLECPCGSVVGKNPSPLAAKLLEGLPWMCQNYKRGCREIKVDIGELEIHQRNCIFRPIYCPRVGCFNKSREIELLFKDLTKHLTDSHGNDNKIQMLEGRRNVWAARLTDSHINFELLHGPITQSTAGRMTSTCGAEFFFGVWITKDGFHCWVNFLGSSDDAKNFTVNYSVEKNAANFLESFIYNGPVQALDKEQVKIVEEQGCLFIKPDAFKRCFKQENRINDLKSVIVVITIKNKGEHYGESDESEKKPTVKRRKR